YLHILIILLSCFNYSSVIVYFCVYNTFETFTSKTFFLRYIVSYRLMHALCKGISRSFIMLSIRVLQYSNKRFMVLLIAVVHYDDIHIILGVYFILLHAFNRIGHRRNLEQPFKSERIIIEGVVRICALYTFNRLFKLV